MDLSQRGNALRKGTCTGEIYVCGGNISVWAWGFYFRVFLISLYFLKVVCRWISVTFFMSANKLEQSGHIFQA